MPGFALPAGLGLAIGGFTPRILAPLLLVLGLAMCGVYGRLTHIMLTYTDVSPDCIRSRGSSRGLRIRRGGGRRSLCHRMAGLSRRAPDRA